MFTLVCRHGKPLFPIRRPTSDAEPLSTLPTNIMTTIRTVTSFPSDANNQAYVSVHALLVGGLWLPYREVFQDCLHEPASVGSNIPFFAFMLVHPTKGRALFDLGIRKVRL